MNGYASMPAGTSPDSVRASVPTASWPVAHRAASSLKPEFHRSTPARGLALAAIERIAGVVQEETAALKSSAKLDLIGWNNRKSHSIVEFNSALRALSPVDVDQELLQRLAGLREIIADNMSVIRLHLDATREISTLLSDTLQNAESDGTYSKGRNSPGRPA